MKQKLIWLFILAGLLGASGGWLFSRMLLSNDQAAQARVAVTPQELVGRHRPDFRLGSVDGSWVSAADYDGLVLLVNFWATWCEPCRAEMPMLDELQREMGETGFRVLGIALDDVQQARDFVAEIRVSYTSLVGMADVMDASRRYGNASGLLPYSILIDRAGMVRWTRLGELSREELLEEVRPLL